MMSTLTSSNSDSVHTSIFPIVLYMSCAVATLEHSGPLSPKKLGSYRRFRARFAKILLLWRNRIPSPQHHHQASKLQIHARSPHRSVPPIKEINDLACVKSLQKLVLRTCKCYSIF